MSYLLSLLSSQSRVVGDPEDYKIDSLNLYEFPNFGGKELFFYQDAKKMAIDNFGR